MIIFCVGIDHFNLLKQVSFIGNIAHELINIFRNNHKIIINKQIILIESLLFNTIESVELLLKDIKNNHSDLTDREAVENIFNIEVATSFIPKDGIYNELISTGSFELIENRRLKSALLEVYNHLKERNYTISRIIDDDIQDFYATYRKEFKLRIDHSETEDQSIYGQLVVEEFEFDPHQ